MPYASKADQKTYFKKYYQRTAEKRKTDWQYAGEILGLYKQIVGCMDCGQHFIGYPGVLDFDHLPGTTKKFILSERRRYSWAACIAEVEKCDVVCANCHRIRTMDRRA